MNNPFNIPDEILETLPAPTDFKFQYPASLPHDVALSGGDEETLTSILNHHNLSLTDYTYIESQPAFRQELAEWRSRIQTEGYGLKVKARALAEDYLPKLYQLMNDDSTAPSVKLESHKHLIALAGLAPTKETQQNKAANQVTKLVIKWADGSTIGVQTGGSSSDE